MSHFSTLDAKQNGLKDKCSIHCLKIMHFNIHSYHLIHLTNHAEWKPLILFYDNQKLVHKMYDIMKYELHPSAG